MTSKLATLALVLMLLNMFIFEVGANEELDRWNSEIVDYIKIRDRVLPEDTSLRCIKGALYKSGRLVRLYSGIAIPCEIIKLPRGEYNETSIYTLY